MPVAFPLGLRTIITAEKSRRQPASFGMADPRRGPGYAEPVGTDRPYFFDAVWRFTTAEAQTFRAWFSDDLDEGLLEFTMPVKTETGLRELTLRFLPDNLLDSREVGALWEYRATIMTRSLAGPLIVPAPPPPAPAPAPVSGWFYSQHERAVVFTAGEGGALVQTELAQALAASVSLGVPLMLPPWDVQFNGTLVFRQIVGVPGKSRLVPSTTFTRTGFANQFMLINASFSQGYNESTADEILLKDFDLYLAPGANGGIVGLGNVKRGLIERCNITATRAINGATSKPYQIDSLIDLYTCVKRVKITKCELRNITGAYGTTKLTEGGGGCLWIRNIRGAGASADTITEDNVVDDNDLEHATSDEYIAVYGVRGVTRNNSVRLNRIKAYSIDGVFRNSGMSIFPLDDGSGAGLGDTAAVYDNEFADNVVEDSGTMYDVLRIGNGADASRPCYNNRSRGNRVTSIRSSGPTGQRATWLALGSPGLDPEIASSVFRCIDGTFGLAYFRDTSGNSSTNDVAINNGATANTGFQSFQQVTNPTSLGDLYSGVSNCRSVQGGKIECAQFAFFNCRQVVGTNYRQNLVGGAVFYVNVGIAGVFSMTNTLGESFGKLAEITGAAPAATVVTVYNNTCQMTGGASGYPTLENGSSSGAKIVARQNVTRGANSAITAGAGTITRSLNDWNGTTD
jgi:hypothetical protein